MNKDIEEIKKRNGFADAASPDDEKLREIASEEIRKSEQRKEIQAQVDRAFNDPEFQAKARKAIEQPKETPAWTVRRPNTSGK